MKAELDVHWGQERSDSLATVLCLSDSQPVSLAHSLKIPAFQAYELVKASYNILSRRNFD